MLLCPGLVEEPTPGFSEKDKTTRNGLLGCSFYSAKVIGRRHVRRPTPGMHLDDSSQRNFRPAWDPSAAEVVQWANMSKSWVPLKRIV